MSIHRLYGIFLPYFRRRRFRRFLDWLRPARGLTLLDVGGYPGFWSGNGENFRMVLLNLKYPREMADRNPGVWLVEGDGTRLAFRDGAFDLVFSNSVIEHLSTLERQQRFAEEARRVGRRVWVQTPARWFPVEPHLVTPLVHYLPKRWQRLLLRHFTVWGWILKPGREQVDAFLREVRLLTFREMQALFPDCRILRERFLGLTKSYIAVR